MGVFYNPQGAMPIAQIGYSQSLGGGFSPRSKPAKKGRDIAAEKWDKEQADEKEFDRIVAESVNTDTGEIDYISASKSLRLKGLSKEADVAEEQSIKTTKARMEQVQQKEMDDLNDTAQALQLVTSGSPNLKKIGMAHLQKNDPSLVDVTPADKDGFFYNEHRDDGAINKVSAEKIWNAQVTAKDLLSLKQADEQFRFKVEQESKRWSVDQLKALSVEKYLRIEAKKFQNVPLDPNSLSDNLTKADIDSINQVLGKDQYISVALQTLMQDPKFRVKVMRDPTGATEEIGRHAAIARAAVEQQKPEPRAPKTGGKEEPVPKTQPTTKIEIEYKGKKQRATATEDGLIIMKNKAGEEKKVHATQLKRAEELGYEPK
jgi:hypothetical protein